MCLSPYIWDFSIERKLIGVTKWFSQWEGFLHSDVKEDILENKMQNVLKNGW